MVDGGVVGGVVLDVVPILEGGPIVVDVVAIVCWSVVVAAIGVLVVVVVCGV
jgi:hypothetical protein